MAKRITGPKITEADVQQACCDLLRLDGWRVFDMEFRAVAGRRRALGETGMPDVLAIRYSTENTDPSQGYAYSFGLGIGHGGHADGSWAQDTDVIWIEFKAPGKLPSAHQSTWHKDERRRGALVLVVDDIDGFRRWYNNSGLARNVR